MVQKWYKHGTKVKYVWYIMFISSFTCRDYTVCIATTVKRALGRPGAFVFSQCSYNAKNKVYMTSRRSEN